MIRFQDLPDGTRTSIVRFYEQDDPGPMADYAMVATINWEPPSTAWIHGMKGVGSRRLWREMAIALDAREVIYIRAFRVQGRILPGAEEMPDGSYRIRVAQFVKRPVDTNFSPL